MKEEAMKGRGMPYFEKDHWQKDASQIDCAGGRYASELNTMEEYKKSTDKLSSYVKSHRAEH